MTVVYHVLLHQVLHYIILDNPLHYFEHYACQTNRPLIPPVHFYFPSFRLGQG